MLSTKDILKRLRTVREEKLLSQVHLAKRLNIDRTTYIRKEKGHIPITTEEWMKIAAAMDKEPSYFFDSGRERPRGTREVPMRSMGRSGSGEAVEEPERLVIALWRTLNAEEKRDFAACLRLIFRGVRKKKVQGTLSTLAGI
ncbi:MAG: helix-turn-helix transcriptional regulator [Thermodesulfobacteriota bacterium]